MVASVALHPDGRRALSASLDGTVKTFELATGHELVTFAGHKAVPGTERRGPTVRGACFLPDGRRAVSAGDKECLRVWDIATGEELFSIPIPDDVYFALAPLPDGRVIGAAARGAVDVWDLDHRVRVRSMPPTPTRHSVYSVAVSPSGDAVLSAGVDKEVTLWEVATGRDLLTFHHPGSTCGVAFSPDGLKAATGCSDGVVRLWDLTLGSRQEPERFEGHGAIIAGVDFTPDGRRLVTAGRDGTLRVWDVANPKKHPMVLSGHRSWLSAVAVSKDGSRAVSGSDDQTVRIWDLERGREDPPSAGHASRVERLALSPDGQYVLSQSYDKDLELRETATGSLVVRFEKIEARAIGFGSDGHALVAQAEAVRALDHGIGTLLAPLPDSADVLVFESVPGWTLTGDADGRIRIVEAATGETKLLRTGKRVFALAAPPGAAHVLSAGEHGAIEVRRRTGELQGLLVGHGRPLLALVATEERAVSAGLDGTVRTWDLKTMKESGEPRRLPADTAAVALSRDGARVLIAEADGTIVLEDRGGATLDRVTLAPFGEVATALEFAPDGRSFIAGLGRGVILRFELVER